MRLTRREKILLGLLLFAILFYGSHRLIVLNQQPMLDNKQAQVDSLTSNLQRLQQIDTEEANVRQQLEEVSGEIDEIKGRYFQLIDEQEEVILLLNEFLQLPNFQTISVGFTEPVIPDGEDAFLYFMDVTVNYETDYTTLFNLVRTLENFERRILLEHLSMRRLEGLLLEGTMRIRLYDLTPVLDETTPLFRWVTQQDSFRSNPFSELRRDGVDPIRYVFRNSETAMGAQRPYEPYEDISGHWAEDAINALGERGVFPATESRNYLPEEPITRGEFLLFLDRLYNWSMPKEPVDLTQFADYEELGQFEGAMAKAIYNGYLSGIIIGFDDNTLRPNDPIRYLEVEFIMAGILEAPDFSWQEEASQMQEETGHSSLGLTDSTAVLTRGEAAYFLNGLPVGE